MTLVSVLIMVVHGGDRDEISGSPVSATSPQSPTGHAQHAHEFVVPVASVQPTELPRTGWTVTADSEELVAENNGASNVLDGSPGTFWHTKYIGGTDPLPHSLIIDMKAVNTVAGLEYLPRSAAGSPNGTIGQYRVEVSLNGTTWGAPVANGTFADNATLKTVAFGGVSARYVRFTALTEAGGRGPWSSASEINVLGTAAPPTTTPTTTTAPPVTTTTVPPTTTTAPPAPVVLPRTGWTVVADSEELVGDNNGASNVLDGNPATFWHTKYIGGTDPLPHSLTIDMKTAATVSALKYLPRPASGSPNGTIGQYRVELSLNGTTWGTPVATGTFADNATEKTATFTAASARYVRFTALTEAGGRGPWSNAAEINILGSTTSTTTTAPTITTTVPPTTTTTPPATVVLPRVGWTVVADSQELVAENNGASNVLDGDPGTFWHTKYIGGNDPLPHGLTIDMKTAVTVSGLRYLPRPAGGSPNGTIGQYRVEVSLNGTAWGTPVVTGTFADNPTEKTTTFPAASARYVRFTALTEAGGRGPWSSAGEVNILGQTSTTPPTTTTPPPPASAGSWSAPTGFPIIPAAAAMLRNGKMLVWSAYRGDNFGLDAGLTQTAIYDPATGAVTQEEVSNTGHDMFCPGTAMLADGRLLVNGGSDSDKTSIYDPVSDTWSVGSPLATPRGYQSAVTLSDGQVFTLGGSWSGGVGGKNGEIWSPTTGSRALPDALIAPALTADPNGGYRSDNHLWLFTWTNGRVFQAGPSKAMNWYGVAGTGSVTAAGTRSDDTDAMNGNAVMYEPGHILTVGGAPGYENSNATSNAYLIDITGPAVSVTKLASMANTRSFANSVVLPDGKVIVVGGQNFAVPFSDDTAVLTPEMWDPVTKAFTALAPMAVPRTYHSDALLLPDGRVFSGGGGLCGTCTTNHFNGQIFTPPYLLNADGSARSRPTITAAPTTAAAGSNITVTTNRAVTNFSLVRTGSATHTVDTDQRRIPLTIGGVTGTTATLAIPADHGVMVPGYYMLFALDATGVPSVSKMVKIT